MIIIPPALREAVPLPVASLPTARLALAYRMDRLREEIANCRHHAIEVGLLDVAERLGRATEVIAR